MERPQHDVQVVNAKSGKNRTVGMAVAVGLNAAVIAALVVGLNNAKILKEMADIKASVEAEKVPPKAPPSEWQYVAAAYLVVFVFVLSWVAIIASKLQRLQRQLGELVEKARDRG